MPVFTYTAFDAQQRTCAGELQAATRQAAARQLRAGGMQPVSLHEAAARKPSRNQPTATNASGSRPAGKFSARHRLPFLKALTALVVSGYPVGESLRLLPRRLKDPALRELSVALWERLSAGATFSRVLEDFPAVFDAQSINLIRAGEATGNVREVLQRLIEHYVALQQLRRRVIGALAYPLFICLVATGVLVFFAVFLMPRLQGLLHSLGGTLPLPTRILLVLSNLLVAYGPVLLALIAGLAAGLAWWRKTPAGRMQLDRLSLRLPLAGPLLIETMFQNYCLTLAVLLENGITTVEAMRIAERTVSNRILRLALRQAADAVVEGQVLTQALARVPHVPDAMLDRFSLGESTGRLAPQLRDLATEMDAELSHRLKSITEVMSTAVLLFAFGFVGFVAYATVSAVFQVSASFKF